jgi:hypothetical protein
MCEKCKRIGLLAKSCRESTDGKRACYECGDPNHLRYDGPNHKGNKNNNGGNGGNQSRERAFLMGAKDAREDPHVVTGTFLLNNNYASILFDIGADRFLCLLNLHL